MTCIHSTSLPPPLNGLLGFHLLLTLDLMCRNFVNNSKASFDNGAVLVAHYLH